jgi:VWFA-related protein
MHYTGLYPEMTSMTRVLFSLPLLAVTLSIANVGSAQTTAQVAPSAIPTLKANSRIVVIDVGVNDSKGNPIKNLKASDFTLKESGTLQTIAHFEEFTAVPPADAGKFPEMPKLPANTFTNYSPVPAGGALNVLLLDTLNTPMNDQSYVRGEMLKYLKTPHPGTRMAIFGLNMNLVLLQGFTSDPEVLWAAIASAKNGPKASVLMNNAVSGDQPGQDNIMDTITDSLAENPDAAMAVAAMQQFDAELKSYQLQMRIQYTLDAMNDLARYLSGLPGRKNLIWFSGSFPINIMPDSDLINPSSIAADFSEEFHKTSAMLARAQVAVYPIDARGLMTNPILDASNSGANIAKANPKAMMKDQQTFTTNQANEHGTMEQMAEDTGGKAFVNTNDLTTAVQKAVETGANYYSLVYAPTNKDWKGDYRKIQVQLAKAGYTLTYRHGYYADDPDAIHKDEPKEAPMMLGGGRRGGMGGEGGPGTGGPGGAGSAAADPGRVAMRAAMQFGGPDPTQILFKTAINPATGLPEDKVAKNNAADPKLAGPFERYVIYVAALPSDFTFTPAPGGKHRMAVELVTNVYNSNGELMNMNRTRARGDIDDAQYAAMQRAGLQFKQEISVPVKGQSFLRIGLHDLATDRVGAVEIPVASVAKLKPLETAAPAAAPAPATPVPAKSPAPPPTLGPPR